MIARLEVTRGTLTEYPLAEKTQGGWQNGVTFYPDAEVTKVTPLEVRQALTPVEAVTEDDREALNTLYWTHPDGHLTGLSEDAIDALLSAGFRRSVAGEPSGVVPEPSAEGSAFIAIMPPSPETSKRWYSMYCRECGIEECMAETADDPRLISRRDEHNREHRGKPEPSESAERRLRDEFEYRIRTAVTYGAMKDYREIPSQVRADWIQNEISKAMSHARAHGLIAAAVQGEGGNQ